MLALSSDIKKLFAFVRESSEITDPDALVAFYAKHDVAVISNPFGEIPEPTSQELVEWALFQLFLMHECDLSPATASLHTDWVQSRGTLLKDWMGEMGVGFAKVCGFGPTQKSVDLWKSFLEANNHRTLDDITGEFKRQQNERLERLRGILKTGKLLNGRKLSGKNRQLILEEVDSYARR